MDGWLGKGIEVLRDDGGCGKGLNLKEWCFGEILDVWVNELQN